MLLKRTFGFVMEGARAWLVAATLHSLLVGGSGGHHRRSMPTPTTFPLSKGGWRPVINSGLPGYGAFAAAPLHAQPYKIPIAVAVDNYPSSSRPISTRDATKLTSIAQSYRPTTLRSLPSTSPSHPQGNQPINSYYNPFGLQNSGGLSHFKIVQNFPGENVVIRNPHNPYAARPVYAKYPTKFKQQFHNSVMQQLNNVQPIQFGVPVYPTTKQQEFKQVDQYGRPVEAKRPQASSGTEIFKPEVYKVPSDSDTAPQSVSQQQVKTAQQQNASPTLKPTGSPYPQYQFKEEKFAPLPPSILGTFSSYGVQSIKGRDPFQQAKTTYIPSQPTKQTVFNSFSFAPYFKTTPSHFAVTTPKFQTALNQIHYGSTLLDYKATSAQPPKAVAPQKVDPNAGKPNFKPSPQDPFSKLHQNGDQNKVSTYNPNNVQTTTANSYFFNNFNDRYPSQYTQNLQNPYYINNQHANFVYDNKKAHIHDSIPSHNNQYSSAQYAEPPKRRPENEATQNSIPVPATYEVTETYEPDIITNSSPNSWAAITDSYDQSDKQLKPSEDPVTKDEYSENYGRLPTTQPTDLVDEYAIVTESDKGYENSLSYDSHVETQSRRPLGDGFEPINKHKLKDYYYRVSTPSHEEYTTHYKKKGKPTEATPIPEQDLSTHKTNEDNTEALPTLPPNRHFKRPNAPEAIDRDKIRKRNKIRRRRPVGNNNEETSTRKSSTEAPTTEADEIHTIKPRVRAPKPKPALTTPTTSTDLSTSALPTISPTSPTVVKKKVGHRRPQPTTTERVEATTFSYKEYDLNKESPIMKIATRPQHPRVTTATYDYKTSETPDYSHKQDEKDTPTSDIAVNLSDTLKTKPEPVKQFSFHKDVKPIDAKLEVIRLTTEGDKRDSTEEASELATTTGRVESSSETPGKIQRPRLKNKYESSRPKFSVKDYRNRLSSTTTTDKPTEAVPIKFKFPQRRLPAEKYSSDNETVERKKFTPKDPRHKSGNYSEGDGVTETVHYSTRQPSRQRHASTTESTEGTPKISSRIRNGSRRPKPTEETTDTSSSAPVHIKRPLRKKIKDSDIGESVQDLSVTETTVRYENKDDITSERTRSESAIMKIAKDDKKHQTEHLENAFEHSKRVSDLTLAASKDYNTPGMFKTVSPNSRRIPNYFTIATDDPILPIEAFFPQLNQKKES